MPAAPVQESDGKLSLPALTAMVGSMVGGVFQLPTRFATRTGLYGALIAWAIAGAGMPALAFVFQALAVRKPQLDNGVYVSSGHFGRGNPRELRRIRMNPDTGNMRLLLPPLCRQGTGVAFGERS